MSGSVNCPECDATLNLKEVVQGEIVHARIAASIWKWSS